MKAIKQAELNDILNSHYREEISASKANELVNEKADAFAIGFKKWMGDGENLLLNAWRTDEELLELYKKHDLHSNGC